GGLLAAAHDGVGPGPFGDGVSDAEHLVHAGAERGESCEGATSGCEGAGGCGLPREALRDGPADDVALEAGDLGSADSGAVACRVHAVDRRLEVLVAHGFEALHEVVPRDGATGLGDEVGGGRETLAEQHGIAFDDAVASLALVAPVAGD